MTTVNEWIKEDARRRAPEFDFGTQWTREHDPHTEWAVTYNTGTGELYARTRNGDDVEILGQFADPQDIAEALPDWGRRSPQAGSLDWARREALAVHQPSRDVDTGLDDPIYGIVINTDGSTVAFREPQHRADIAIELDTDDLDVAVVNTGDRTDRVVMWVDNRSNDHDLPVNATATQLYGTGWPIVGNAVVVTDDQRPLPRGLVHDLLPDLDNPDPTLDQQPDVAALDWEDHLIDRERSDADLGIEDDDWDIDHDWDVDDDTGPGDDYIEDMSEPTADELDYETDLEQHNDADEIRYYESQPDLDDGTDIDL